MPSANTSCLIICFICDVNITSLYFSAYFHRAHHERDITELLQCTTPDNQMSYSTRYVTTKLTRPKSSELCHMVCHLAMCV